MRMGRAVALGVTRGQRGLTLIEVLAAMAIGSLVLGTIYLAMGTAIRARLKVGVSVHNQQHGRLIVQWIADRVRQAGYAVDKSSAIARCRDAVVVEDAGLQPTSSQLYVNADLDGVGTGEPTQTIGFISGAESVAGTAVPVVVQSVADCTTGAAATLTSLIDPTSVRLLNLRFDYYDANGAVVTDLVTSAGIRSIRRIRVTVTTRATAGPQEAEDQTWTTLVQLRNPDPRTL